MNERTTLEKIAASVDEAVAEGLTELGLPAEAVDVEILDAGSRGLLGMGVRQARVRLTIKEVEQAAPAASSAVQATDDSGQQDELLSFAQKTVTDILEKMKLTALANARYGDPDDQGNRPIRVDIHGDDLEILTARRAEILNAMQYIVNLIISKQAEHWVQVTIDVEGYRERREQQLRQLARRMAEQAVKTGHRQALEPMPPGERRIIHMELQGHAEVTTQSVGDEPGRKVTIVPK